MDREEAINIVRKNIPHLGLGATEMTEALGVLIPELRESEDERIRKAIFKALSKKDARDVLLAEGVQVSEALAYLEKQKELTPADGWDYADKRMSHPLYLEGFEAGRAVERVVSEQEWSEEDEDMLEYIIGDVNDAKQLYTTQEAKDIADKEIAWLKSLRPCPSWKPSEEQMEAFEESLMSVAYTENKIILESLLEQLKKLM